MITQAVAKREAAPIYLARGQQSKFQSLIATEEEEWESEQKRSRGGPTEGASSSEDGAGSFEEYREKSKAAGVM